MTGRRGRVRGSVGQTKFKTNSDAIERSASSMKVDDNDDDAADADGSSAV